MSDNPQTIGSYPIERELGRGGMGIVYLARDPRLQRLVAIKVLPDAFARDPERLARFEREARLLASLNHPNIAAIHGLEEDGGHRYLILEYVEGETLAEHLGRGALPIDESLDACRQIAAALEAAHESGVIHRDLKPGNVKRTPGGEIKVLDFGLAKGGAAESSPDLSHSPTIAYNMTGAGVILGTAAYMSPEQARGKTVDRRTDIWSFGCVLYECLTGRQLFHGETVSDMIAKILEREPDWSALPAQTPEKVRELLRRMLEKDSKKRLRDIGDARIELEEALAARVSSGRILVTGAGQGNSPAAHARPAPAMLAWVAGVTAAITAAVTILVHGCLHQPPDWAVKRFSIAAPASTKLDEDAMQCAISPSGRMVAFTATDSGGTSQIYVRSLDTLAPRAIPGTDNAAAPFWSPDSRFLAFFAEGKLKKASLAGGEAEALANASNGRGGTWNRENVIVYAPEGGGPLFRISANGGDPQQITALDSTRHETAHRFPWFLPDGKHFLYVSLPAQAGKHDVWVGSLDSPKRVRVMGAEESPVYAEPGYLIYPRGHSMVAQRFDLGSLKLNGDPIVLPDEPGAGQSNGYRVATVGSNGTLAYLNGRQVTNRLVWFDRTGRQTGTLALPSANYQWVALSPDGRTAAIVRQDSPGQSNLWMVDLQSAVPTRFTFGNTLDNAPLFWPDGSRLIYQSNPNGRFDLFVKGITAGPADSTLVASEINFKYVDAVTKDGRSLLFEQLDSRTGWDLMVLPLDGSGAAHPLLRTSFNERWATLSPDGRWIAYTSDESGRAEVYVQSFPNLGSKMRVSTAGGNYPQWRNDGKEILFYGPDYLTVTSAATEISPTFHAQAPRVLFKFPSGTLPPGFTPDFQRFLAPIPESDNGSASISVVLDWRAGLVKQ
jgi:Tol biopolymer transport system component